MISVILKCYVHIDNCNVWDGPNGAERRSPWC